MSERIIYRRQLLRAVEAFLEGTPSAQARGHHIIQDCSASIGREMTLDEIIWGFFIHPLGDSIYYESEEFLRETQEILLGQNSHNVVRTAFSDDYRAGFTADEAEWYGQLVSLGDFLTTIPFAQLHQATFQAMQSQENRDALLATLPEAAQIEKIEEEYLQRTDLIQEISARCPSPENVGDEKIAHFVLREVSSILTEIHVGIIAVSVGYPILYGFHSSYVGLRRKRTDMTESVLRAKRFLEALAGKGELFISWRLSKATTFDGDLLILSLH